MSAGEEGYFMSNTITGVVTNGVIVPSSPLPEGARGEIRLEPAQREGEPRAANYFTLGALRWMPREQRQAVLAAAAKMAELDYRCDKELTGFEALSEERLEDESDAR